MMQRAQRLGVLSRNLYLQLLFSAQKSAGGTGLESQFGHSSAPTRANQHAMSSTAI